MSNLLLGLDLGTSAVKVGLFDLEGNLLRRARRAYSLYTPRPGWPEQEPEEWWVAICDGLQEVLAGMDGTRIAAVGLSGQSPSQVLATAEGIPLGRAIVWSDRRATVEAGWLAEHVTLEQARAWADCTFTTGVNRPLARFLWLKTHRPDDWMRCAAVVQPKDFVACRLTGRIATDVNSALGLFNPRTGQYAAGLLALLGIKPERMPLVLERTAIVGYVMPEVSPITGLLPGIPFVTGTINAWCDMIGCEGIESGCAVGVAATSEVVVLVTTGLFDGDSEGVASTPLASGCSWVGGPMQMGGAALVWLARCFCGQQQQGFRSLGAEASAAMPGADGLLFLPYLQGERAPVWDPMARGAFVGLTDRHMRAHCFRAVYEGVAFAVRDLLKRCQVAAGIAPKILRISGGGSISTFWNQIKADVTGLPVQQVAIPDAACLGAVLLAAIGVGIFDGFDEASRAMIRIGNISDPVPVHASRYSQQFVSWRCLYPALRPFFPRLEA